MKRPRALIPLPHRSAREKHNREDFGDDEEAFRSAVEWQHARLKGSGGPRHHPGEAYGEGSNTRAAGESRDGAPAQRGAYVAFAEHGNALRAREVLEEAFSPESVATLTHSRRGGTGFLVHASASGVDALLEGGGTDERVSVLEGLFALPPAMKLAPSLAEYLGQSQGVAVDPGGVIEIPPEEEEEKEGGDWGSAGRDEMPHGRAGGEGGGFSEGSGGRPEGWLYDDGLVLYLSPGSVAGDSEEAVMESWRRDWGAPDLDLLEMWHWSSARGAETGAHEEQEEEGEELWVGADWQQVAEPAIPGAGAGSGSRAASAARHWAEAAGLVRSLARRAGMTPAEACGWDGVRVAAEGPGLVTIRGDDGWGFCFAWARGSPRDWSPPARLRTADRFLRWRRVGGGGGLARARPLVSRRCLVSERQFWAWTPFPHGARCDRARAEPGGRSCASAAPCVRSTRLRLVCPSGAPHLSADVAVLPVLRSIFHER